VWLASTMYVVAVCEDSHFCLAKQNKSKISPKAYVDMRDKKTKGLQ
jgi:hypothetical protein